MNGDLLFFRVGEVNAVDQKETLYAHFHASKLDKLQLLCNISWFFLVFCGKQTPNCFLERATRTRPCHVVC